MKTIVTALRLLLVLTLLTGVIYPLMVTGIAKTCFAKQAEGSLIRCQGVIIGSELIAQSFTNEACFWPRPSSADFATVPSGASNQGPTNRDLKRAIGERAARYRDAQVPADLLLASGSGLDPHISPEAARFQMSRVTRARRLTPGQQRRLESLVEQSIEPPQLGILGEPRVNVLKLNLALDSL
ncbi:MAG: potassium-transporting ATPase subunit KdpC [Verrucomicrobiales bacterium]|nr:potassium-transporting ATPase subunit KdpC [Verrucomicrobiales bacterium]